VGIDNQFLNQLRERECSVSRASVDSRTERTSSGDRACRWNVSIVEAVPLDAWLNQGNSAHPGGFVVMTLSHRPHNLRLAPNAVVASRPVLLTSGAAPSVIAVPADHPAYFNERSLLIRIPNDVPPGVYTIALHHELHQTHPDGSRTVRMLGETAGARLEITAN